MIKTIATSLVFAGGLLMGQAPAKIGVINLQQAVLSTQEGQASIARLQREFVEPKTKELEAMQSEIRDLQDKLQRGGNTMSQTAKDDMQKQIDQKTKVFNRAVEDYDFETQEEQRKTLDDLTTKMRGVIQTYVTSNGFAAVFDTANSGLLWRADSLDITTAIIDAYDKAHPAPSVNAAPPTSNAPAANPTKPAAPGAPATNPPKPATPGTPAAAPPKP